uniref:Uncharacterized protein n=1 Tax=Panthera leo TaxID=9689 RepID=A0A8C8XGV1_PANLE
WSCSGVNSCFTTRHPDQRATCRCTLGPLLLPGQRGQTCECSSTRPFHTTLLGDFVLLCCIGDQT